MLKRIVYAKGVFMVYGYLSYSYIKEGRSESLAGLGLSARRQLSNFLDFFVSFLRQGKNEKPIRLEDIVEIDRQITLANIKLMSKW